MSESIAKNGVSIKLVVFAAVLATFLVVLFINFQNLALMKEFGLAQRYSIDLCTQYVEEKGEWPRSWRDLRSLASTTGEVDWAEEKIRIEFSLSLSEVLDRIERNELPVVPKSRFANLSVERWENLKRAIEVQINKAGTKEAANKGGETKKEENRGTQKNNFDNGKLDSGFRATQKEHSRK